MYIWGVGGSSSYAAAADQSKEEMTEQNRSDSFFLPIIRSTVFLVFFSFAAVLLALLFYGATLGCVIRLITANAAVSVS